MFPTLVRFGISCTSDGLHGYAHAALAVSFAFDQGRTSDRQVPSTKVAVLVVARCKVRLSSGGLFSQNGCDSLPCKYKSLEHSWTGRHASTRREN